MAFIVTFLASIEEFEALILAFAVISFFISPPEIIIAPTPPEVLCISVLFSEVKLNSTLSSEIIFALVKLILFVAFNLFSEELSLAIAAKAT